MGRFFIMYSAHLRVLHRPQTHLQDLDFADKTIDLILLPGHDPVKFIQAVFLVGNPFFQFYDSVCHGLDALAEVPVRLHSDQRPDAGSSSTCVSAGCA